MITTNPVVQDEAPVIKVINPLQGQPIVENPIMERKPVENLPNPNRKPRINLQTGIGVYRSVGKIESQIS